MTDEAEMLSIFNSVYDGAGGVVVASAPGRVNIIGEHTDYNEGYVLPTPIWRCIWVAGRGRMDKEFKLYAHDYCQKHAFTLGRQEFSESMHWANYLMGVVDAMQRKGYKLRGADLAIKGDVPQAAGLSSSAALEVAVARVLTEVLSLEIAPIEIAYLGKSAENDFVGVQSGIMDQFCASLGRHGRALLIDCRTNGHRSAKIPFGYKLVAVHTGVRRKLDSSAYNERVQQCRMGVEAIKRKNPSVRTLRDASLTDIDEARCGMSEVVYRRCRHVITENERVIKAFAALKANDAAELGALMFGSHRSLREDYEVSCPELDSLVDIAMETGHVLGARLTGAGFGGCTINLLQDQDLPEFLDEVPKRYREATGLKPEVYPV